MQFTVIYCYLFVFFKKHWFYILWDLIYYCAFFCNFSTIWAGWTQSRIIGRSPASMIMKKASILCYSLNNNIFSSYIHYYLSGTINTNKYNNNSKHTEDVYDLNICMSHPTLSSWVFSVKKIPEKCFKICTIFWERKKKPK